MEKRTIYQTIIDRLAESRHYLQTAFRELFKPKNIYVIGANGIDLKTFFTTDIDDLF